MKTVLSILKILVALYVLLCVLLYFIQESLIFFPEKLPSDYTFQFAGRFEELFFTTTDKTPLSGVLFKTDSSRGLILYLHGNAGSLRSWGEIAKTYTDLHYDLFMLDYRGYGKSGGSINSMQQVYDDVQLVYDNLKNRYHEKDIIVLGYSIGTGPPTRLAAENHPRLLILQAPYYSLTDMMRHRFAIIPAFILKYPFPNNLFLQQCTMPVIIFHGNKDEVIYYGSSLKLKALFKPADTLITLENQGHNGISDNRFYRQALQQLLNQEK
jgi:alpha-beta hydrolase superfamily lysophospholipase